MFNLILLIIAIILAYKVYTTAIYKKPLPKRDEEERRVEQSFSAPSLEEKREVHYNYYDVIDDFDGVTVALLAKIAKSDGVISKEEANYISEVYRKLADLTGKSLEVIDIYEEIFEREKDRLDNLDEFISKLKGLEEEGRNYLLTILEGVVKIDGNRAIFEKIKEELLKDR